MQAGRVEIDSVPANGSLDVVVTLPRARQDDAYSLVATVENGVDGTDLRVGRIVARTASSATVRVFNLSGAASPAAGCYLHVAVIGDARARQ